MSDLMKIWNHMIEEDKPVSQPLSDEVEALIGRMYAPWHAGQVLSIDPATVDDAAAMLRQLYDEAESAKEYERRANAYVIQLAVKISELEGSSGKGTTQETTNDKEATTSADAIFERKYRGSD